MHDHHETLLEEIALEQTYATSSWLDPARFDIIPPCYGHSPCGVIHAPSTTSCPACRGVPDSDIDSPLTEWECFCGGTCQASHASLCERRQIKRSIARLVATQYEIALAKREKLFLGVVCAYEDSIHTDGLPERVIKYANASRSATTFMDNIPDEVRIQAYSVENCVSAIVITTPIMAWLAENMPIKFRELDIVPNPNKHIVLQRTNDSRLTTTPARFHTVMGLAPDTEKDRTNDPSRHPRMRLEDICHESAYIGDPSYHQYDYDQNCHPAAAYFWDKVKEDDENEVLLFGHSFRAHRHSMAQTQDANLKMAGYLQEACIRTLITAVYREVGLLGGPLGFIALSSHDEFKRGLRQLVDGVRPDLRALRVEVDNIFYPLGPRSSKRQQLMDLEELADEYSGQGYLGVMAALHRMETNAAPLLPVRIDEDAERDRIAWLTMSWANVAS